MDREATSIALVGPVHVQQLRPCLDLSPSQAKALPEGTIAGGTPVTQLAHGLLERGHEVIVVTLDPTLRSEQVYSGPQLRLCVGPARTRGRTRDWYRRERAYLRQALQRENPAVAHAHWTYEYALGALQSGRPTVITVRDWAPTVLRLKPKAHKLVRLGMNHVTVAWGRHFTVTSPYMHRRLQRWVCHPVAMIPNAIGDDLFASPRGSDSDKEPILLSVNNGFSRRKNVKTLLHAFRAIVAARPGSRLRLVGLDYQHGGPAHRWATREGLDTSVEFVGQVTNARVHELLGGADVLVHPALEESFGLVLVEAMAQRVPVVGGVRSGAVPWVLDGGRAGVLVDVRSPGRIAEAVLELLGNPEQRSRIAQAGFRHARDNFRVSKVIDRYEHLYETVRMSNRGRSATGTVSGPSRPPGR